MLSGCWSNWFAAGLSWSEACSSTSELYRLDRLIAMQRLLCVLLLLVLTGCAGLNLPGGQTPQPTIPPSPLPVTPSPTAAFSPTPGPVILQVWLPPEFDPAGDSPAAQLLAARLDEFAERRPGVQVEVRVKAADGLGGLLDSLTTTSAAAPSAMPDLVALPRPVLEVAALKGLLHPFDGLSRAIDDPDWYEYARQLARLQNSTFGLPFAGDALNLVYRPDALSTPPTDLGVLLGQEAPLAFPAADPDALFTLAQYLSAGGSVLDEQGRPHLDREPLERVLALYEGEAGGEDFQIFLTQLANDQAAWDAFLEGSSPMVVTWTSRYLQELPGGARAALLPTLNSSPFTLARGWVWSLAGVDESRQVLAAQLAEFLTEGSFLSEWTTAAGYLPPRPSALKDASLEEPVLDPTPTITATSEISPTAEITPDPAGSLEGLEAPVQAPEPAPPLSVVLDQISLSAQLIPSSDVVISLGPILQEAALGVLKGEVDPSGAAQAAVNRLSAP